MAVYNGILSSDSQAQNLSDRTFLSPQIRTLDDTSFAQEVFGPPSAQIGDRAGLDPFYMPNDYSGVSASSANTPFYSGIYFQRNAVIVNQDVFDLGLISQNTSYSFELWVTFPRASEVATVGILDTSAGITITDLSAGDVFGPYEEKTFQITADVTGPAFISTHLYVTFVDNPDIYMLELGGVRISRFYMLEPNWAEGVTVEKRYLTSVFRSRNMAESRKILRDRPIRSISASVPFYSKNTSGAMWANVRGIVSSTSVLPWWPDLSRMTAPQSGTRIYCDTSYRRFHEGAYAYLASSPLDYADLVFDIVKITTLYADGFDVEFPTDNTYTTGAKVYPCYVADANINGLENDVFNDKSGAVGIEAVEAYGQSMLERENSSYSPEVRNGYPVMPLTVTFSESVSVGVQMGGESMDSGRGALVTTLGLPYITQSVTALASTKEECWQVDGFFNYLRGMGRPFWVQSVMDFLMIKSTSGNNIFTISNITETSDMRYLNYCWVTDSNGDYDILRVLDISESGDDTQVTVETSALVDIVTVRQAHAVRLAEDVITTEYLTDDTSLTSFSAEELQQAGGA